MKKNKIKNVNWYKESIKKYKFGFLTYNIIVFAVVFVLFAIVLTFFVEERFLNNVQEEILKIERKVDSSNGIDYSIAEDDPRLTVVYYYAEPKSGSVESFINPKITNCVIVGNLSYDDVTSIDDISKEREGGFISNEIKGHQYLSLSEKTWKLTRIEDGSPVLVIRVKVYMNIDGELHAKRELGTSIMLPCFF